LIFLANASVFLRARFDAEAHHAARDPVDSNIPELLRPES